MRFLLSLTLLFSSLFVAATPPTKPLELAMKNMALEYKNALKSTNVNDFQAALSRIDTLILESKAIGFKNKPHKSQQGLSELKEIVKKANALSSNDQLIEAKKTLKKMDVLRKQYHKLHEPSVWDLFFG